VQDPGVTPDPSTGAYHHGDLPNSLRRAAADLLTERGVAGFSLREVSRRAGVSHAAPAHHFGDASGLLTAVAVEAFQHLTATTEAAVHGVEDPVEALARLGRAYVEVSRAYPGHCAVVFRNDVVDADDPSYQEWGTRAYGVLVGAVERLADERNPDLDVQLGAALCWSMVQGLLVVHGPLAGMADKGSHGVAAVPPIGDLAEALTRLVIHGLGSPRP
jgi:AcrR family transcriptional regulator